MLAQNSLFDLPSLDSIIDRTPLTGTSNTLVGSAIALMSQAKENSCELLDTDRHQTLDLLNRERNSCLLVVEAGKLTGIFTERDAVKLAASQRDFNEMTIAQVMTKELITLKRSPNQTIFTALSLLHRHRIHHLPILDEQRRLYGLVTSNYIRQILQPVNLLKLKTVDEMMTKEIVHAPSTTSILNIAKLMDAHRISCVVLVEELGSREAEIDDAALQPVGIITERDIVQFQVLGLNLANVGANQVMSTPLFTLKPEDTLWLAQSEMQQRRIRRLVVTGERGELQGLITQTDLLQAIDPVELWNVINLLQQQVGEKTTELERSNRELQQENSRRQEAEAELKQINDSLKMQIQERTAELTDFIENAVVPMHWVTSDGTISWANKAELEMLGYAKEEYIGRSIVEFHADQPVINELLSRLSNNEAVQNYQARLRCKNGSICDVLIDSNVSWRNGEFVHTRCFTRNVTESLKAEELRRQSEAQLQAILDNTQAVIYLKDKQGRYLLINRRYEQVFNLDREKVKGKTDLDIFPKEIAEGFQANDRQVIEERKPLELEELAPQADGLHTYFSIKFPLFDSSGSVYGICGISTDITERKQTGLALQETLRSLEFQKYALDRAAIVAITDARGIITYVNSQFCQISQYE
ncbi:MAG: CBS domain-containing protein, partial [Chroococcidiopsis sp.]